MTGRPRQHWVPIFSAALAALTVAILGGMATDLSAWYEGLTKPSWQPPGWLFGPAWTLIFGFAAMAGISAWVRARDGRERQRIIVLFALNGFLNILWSGLFFRLRRPDWALSEVALLWLSVAILILGLWGISRRASWLLVPYLCWVAFAAYLNLAIVRLNAPFSVA